MRHIIPKGTTEPQDFELRDQGVAIVGTGTVALEIYRKVNGVMEAVTVNPPTVDWLNQAAGTVRVLGVSALAADTYYVRFKLTDSGGAIGYAPNGEKADRWRVVEVPTP